MTWLLPLLARRWREAAIVALALAVTALGLRYRASLIEQGRREADAKWWRARAAALAVTARRIDTLIVTQTAVEVRWRTKLDSFPLPPIADSVPDTTQVFATAGAIRACGLALSACDSTQQLLRARLALEIDGRRADSTAWATQVPPVVRKSGTLRGIIIGAAAAFVAGRAF